jgi:prevent-host-death family protein
MKTMTSAEAQNHFGALLDAAQREPVTITRRGRPVAFLISPEEFTALRQGVETAQSATLRDAVAAFRGSGKGGGVKRLLADREDERRREL